MTTPVRILAFAGSAREGSFNKQLVRVAAEGAREAGAEVTLADLRDYPMPVFDEDLEAAEGSPENAVKFKQLMLDHQGLLIAAPEYNSSITAALKNTIDWASRPAEGQPATCEDETALIFLQLGRAFGPYPPGSIGAPARGLKAVRGAPAAG